MELKYYSACSTAKPDIVQFEKTTVYLHKDFSEEVVKDSNGNKVYSNWTYQEAALSYDEFEKYSASMISQLVTNQENGDNNQLIIMEAIADLYDVIANMTSGGVS